MKIRSDYVSNSSSSCYVVVTKKPVGQYTFKQWEKFFKNKDLAKPFYDKLKDVQPNHRSTENNNVYCILVEDGEEYSGEIYDEYKNNSPIIKGWDDLTLPV